MTETTNNTANNATFSELYDQDPAIVMARRLGITETTTGMAFTLSFKLITLCVLAAIAYWGRTAFAAIQINQLSLQSNIVLWGGLALVAYTAYHIMVSRTTVSPTHIEQRFVFARRMHLGELSYAKFIYIPYLTWLIAPRLYIRSAQGKFMAIYGASHALHQQFGMIHRVVNTKAD